MKKYLSCDLMSIADGGIEVWGLNKTPRQGIPTVGETITIRGKIKKVLDTESDSSNKYDHQITVKQVKAVESPVAEGAGDEWTDGLTLKQAMEKAKPNKLKIRRKGGRYEYADDKWIDPEIDDISVEDALAEDWLVELKQDFKRIDVEAGIKEALRLYKLEYKYEDCIKQGMKIAEERDLGEEVEDEEDN